MRMRQCAAARQQRIRAFFRNGEPSEFKYPGPGVESHVIERDSAVEQLRHILFNDRTHGVRDADITRRSVKCHAHSSGAGGKR